MNIIRYASSTDGGGNLRMLKAVFSEIKKKLSTDERAARRLNWYWRCFPYRRRSDATSLRTQEHTGEIKLRANSQAIWHHLLATKLAYRGSATATPGRRQSHPLTLLAFLEF